MPSLESPQASMKPIAKNELHWFYFLGVPFFSAKTSIAQLFLGLSEYMPFLGLIFTIRRKYPYTWIWMIVHGLHQILWMHFFLPLYLAIPPVNDHFISHKVSATLNLVFPMNVLHLVFHFVNGFFFRAFLRMWFFTPHFLKFQYFSLMNTLYLPLGDVFWQYHRYSF